MKDQIKQAFDLAENEVEQKQIEHLKSIIKNILQKKKDKEKEIDTLQEEVKVIKQDIDDFKAGRLDKIKERHDLNPKANSVAPIFITIINDNRKIAHPTRPWMWGYEVTWGNNSKSLTGNSFIVGSQAITTGYTTIPNTSSNNTYLCSSGSGTTFATNAVGTYVVNDDIINL